MNEEEIQRRLAEADPVRFDAGFADRVMARIEADPGVIPADVFAEALRKRFARLAPAALAASIALCAFSLGTSGGQDGRSTVEVLL